MTTSQEFEYSFICKKTDKFEVLEQKLYKKKPELKYKPHFYLYNGNMINVEKTIEENKIKDMGMIIYNIYDEEFDQASHSDHIINNNKDEKISVIFESFDLNIKSVFIYKKK